MNGKHWGTATLLAGIVLMSCSLATEASAANTGTNESASPNKGTYKITRDKHWWDETRDSFFQGIEYEYQKTDQEWEVYWNKQDESYHASKEAKKKLDMLNAEKARHETVRAKKEMDRNKTVIQQTEKKAKTNVRQQSDAQKILAAEKKLAELKEKRAKMVSDMKI